VILTITGLVFAVRFLAFETYIIPSDSMSPSIENGDYVLVNKLIPGIRFFENDKFTNNSKRAAFWRTKGFRNIKNGDVLVFNYPYSKRNKLTLNLNTHYVKRCIAIPGDTVFIINGFFKINSSIDTIGYYSQQLQLSLIEDKDININILRSFPKKSKYHKWTIKNFGPLYVPQKGKTIDIDSVNIVFYRNLIEYETGYKIKNVDNIISLNDSIINKYTFLIDYYFMAGDNVIDSKDSRYWGLLPEDHIIGVAFLIWKSKDVQTGDFRWNRFFRQIE